MKSHNLLAIIPARGGSKGIPRKNIKNIAGKPLISWTIDAAKQAECIDKLIVSTDDEEIAEVSLKWGAEIPFMRPKGLAQDDSLRNAVVAHALGKLPDFNYVMLLQPTSPMRTSVNIEEAFHLLKQVSAPACVSVVEQDKSPYWMFNLNSKGCLEPILPILERTNRQELPKTYLLNGAIYISTTKHFWTSQEPDPFITTRTVAYKMDFESSMDIDTLQDWQTMERLIEENHLR